MSTRFDDFDQNKLSILTFNYDRSLEHYLLTALQHSYGKPIEDCAQKLKSIPIVHLHGDLGCLPHLGENSVRPYNDNINPDSLKVATSRIKIIHENMEDEPQFILAKQLLSVSQTICFLGFGYHPLNVKRLGFDAPGYATLHVGSTMGLTAAERSSVSQLFSGRLQHNNAHALDCDVLQFLRQTGVLSIPPR